MTDTQNGAVPPKPQGPARNGMAKAPPASKPPAAAKTDVPSGTDVLVRAEALTKATEPSAPPKPDIPPKRDILRAEVPRAAPEVGVRRLAMLPNGRIPREAFQALAIVGNAIAWLGVMIIVYGIVSTITNETWLPFELFIVPISATLALLAILLNAFVVSLTIERPAAPSPISRYVTAPTVILLSSVGIVSVWFQEMPISVVLGSAILGLAWALIRVLPPYPEI